MEYRRITKADVDQVAVFAVAGLRPELYPSLRVSQEKVRSAMLHFAGSQTDFHLAAFDGNKMVGGIAAFVAPSILFERSEATVLMLRAVVPGVGRRLIAAFKAWVDEQMHIRRVTFVEEFDAPRGLARLMARYGFKQKHTALVYLKG